MKPNEAPAAAGEQLSLAPDSTGPSPADGTATPAGPRASDTTAPVDFPSTTHGAAGTSTGNAQTLARLIAEGRRPRSQRFAALEPYRDVLLAERRSGASIRLLAQSLTKLGVTISEETLRVWLLRQKMPKRRRSRKKPAGATKPKLMVATTTPATSPILKPAASATPATPQVPYGQRKGPRIARDVY
jgi:hypothetical protein